MINKRLLIKNLLAHHDENSFYDKKLKLNLDDREGKAKFLKHVCALSNSNPNNNCYIVVGVDDKENQLIGVDFFDDSKIQNLINAYLEHPPLVQYENVSFPHLPTDKVIGLVSIRSQSAVTALHKNIWKYYGGTVFFREGSISKHKVFEIQLKDINSQAVAQIEQQSRNNIEFTLRAVIDFLYHRHDQMEADYKVFKEQFVVCWAGQKNLKADKVYFSRVDIELVTEQVKLFYSAQDEVEIAYDEDSFSILEYLHLGIGQHRAFYPLEEQRFEFNPNGSYSLKTRLLFQPPKFDKKTLLHLMNHSRTLLKKIKHQQTLTTKEAEDLHSVPEIMLLCQLNEIENAMQELTEHKEYLRSYPKLYASYKNAQRILRKIKYQ
ncbi:MAG: ATP-binding protein [Flavobacteriaceae bacterium]|nr:ATP-binding protein [Flavobacteriaceae bacterium]